MNEPGQRDNASRRKANFRPRSPSKPSLIIGQPTGAPSPAQAPQPAADEAPPTEIGELAASAPETGATAEAYYYPAHGEPVSENPEAPAAETGYATEQGDYSQYETADNFASVETPSPETTGDLGYASAYHYYADQAPSQEPGVSEQPLDDGTAEGGIAEAAAPSAEIDEAPAIEGLGHVSYEEVVSRSSEELAHAAAAWDIVEPSAVSAVDTPVPETSTSLEKAAPGAPATPEPPKPVRVEPALPASFQPRFSPDYAPARRFPFGIVALIAILCLAAGWAVGVYLPKSTNNLPSVNPANTPAGSATTRPFGATGATPPGDRLSAADQTDVDAAFIASKSGHFPEALKMFAALQAKHPEWPSMSVEIGRVQLYQHDMPTARDSLGALIKKGVMAGDANFLLGLLYMTNGNFPEAEDSFAKAVGVDPARPDFYYFWGECLRREGKPLEAISRFRSAMLRNQYETTEGLYRLKYWLSEIQADQENTDGVSGQIEAALAQPRPPMEALFAGAARAIKAKDINAATELLRRGRQAAEPAVYNVIMQDPTFMQENWRPEFRGLFPAPAPPAQPSASPANGQ